MRAEKSSTIGTERLTNYALQIESREEFIQQVTTNLPARPDYFLRDAEINREGAAALTDLAELPAIPAIQLKSLIEQAVPALDVRPGDRFSAGNVPGSINIALSGQFATWAATILGLSSRPVLIADTPEQIEEARMRLARVGIEDLRGFLAGGSGAWQEAGFALAELAHGQGAVSSAATHLHEAHGLFTALQVPKYIARTAQLAREYGMTLAAVVP